MGDQLTIAGKTFRSRLMTGTGKHRSVADLLASVETSGTEIITVAIRRLNLDDPNEKTFLDHLDWDKYQILPNTAGSKTAAEAVFTAHLAREVTGSNWIKIEVIPDPKYLLPDPIGTLEAAEQLIKDGFVCLPYIGADPVLAMRLEDLGCATVMPLGSPIGSRGADRRGDFDHHRAVERPGGGRCRSRRSFGRVDRNGDGGRLCAG